MAQFCTLSKIFGPQSGQNGKLHFPQKALFGLKWVQKLEKWGLVGAFCVTRVPFTLFWFAKSIPIETGPQNSPTSPFYGHLKKNFMPTGCKFLPASVPNCHLLAKTWGPNISNWVSSWGKNPETKNVPLIVPNLHLPKSPGGSGHCMYLVVSVEGAMRCASSRRCQGNIWPQGCRLKFSKRF